VVHGWHDRAEGEVLPWHVLCGGPSVDYAAPVYTDELVLVSCDRAELEQMLINI
jgi:hypothetical protein